MDALKIILGTSGGIAFLAVVTAALLVPRRRTANTPAPVPIDPSEHAKVISALRPPKRERPVVAIVASNEATEISDFLSTYGVLSRSGVADVTVVAARAAPVRLDPLSLAPVRLYSGTLWVEPQATMGDFDLRHPGGADYVVVPAIEPRDDPAITTWIAAKPREGAKIVAVCNGSLTLAAAGLLDGRRATAHGAASHWSGIAQLLKAHPTMQWVRDRRYVIDDGVMTSTGITGSIPAMVALVEAIGGQPKAEQLATGLGLDHWDERHQTSAFQLTGEHRKTFVRNLLSLWRHETVGVPISEGVDETALGLMVDVYARTGLARVVTVFGGRNAVRSRHGLIIRAETSSSAAKVDLLLPPLPPEKPAQAIEWHLSQIAARYGRATAAFVALTMEYPW